MKKLYSIFAVVLTSVLASAEAFAEITINEVMAKNGTTLATASGVKGIDWVEIRNSGSAPVDLSGWYLGNDPTKKTSKWPKIEGSCVVPANGYKIVWCDGDGVCTSWSGTEAHVACNISTDDGKHTVFLASAADTESIVCRLPLRGGLEDISYGYASATGDYRYFPTPTPGAANAANGRTGYTPKVAFSEPHGYKSESFQLSLSCPEQPGADIYYTLNGRKPTVGGTGSTKYTGPITISKTTVVRAAVPDADSLRQNDTSASYLFISDILTQTVSNRPEGFPNGGVTNRRGELQKMGYGMRAASKLGDVDAATATARLYNGFTNGIRTVSLVFDPDDMFDVNKGIYVNAREEGKEWERQTMAEQIYPVDTNDEFSVSCGIRIRGAFSRMGYAKHAFRLFFRSEYGMSSLNHPLFGDEGPKSFGKIDLRCDQNSSWVQTKADTTLIHEVWVRDTQRDMGQPYNKSRYYHLFLNGCYWGIYQTEERVDQKYCADTIGGEEDNFDVVRTSNTGGQNYTTGIVEGDTTAWSNFWHITMNEGGYGKGHEDNYYRVRGLNPDGTRNPDYPVYLNVTNLICYMLSAHYAIDTDGPVSASIKSQNNVIGYRNRVDGDADIDGFLWNRHDAENALAHPSGKAVNAYLTDIVRLGTRDYGRTELKDFGPSMLNWELCQNAEYRRIFGDLVQKMIISPNGAMAPKASKARYRARMAEIDDAVMAELARWGGNANYERIKSWIPACEKDLSFFDQRTPYLLQAYRDSKINFFPSIDAAKVLDASSVELGDGDKRDAGSRVYLTGSNVGTVYYTTDGSDPCLRDGSVSDKALVYSGTSTSGGLEVPAQGLKIMARIKTSTEWSALSEVAIVTDEPAPEPEKTVYTGVYNEPVEITADASCIFSNATLNAGLTVADGVTAKLNSAADTVNKISTISAAGAEVRFTGDGTMKLEGTDTLATVKNLLVKSGTLQVKSTGVSATKKPVINVLGFVEQTGGVIDMNLDVATTNQIYGIYVANKNEKDAEGNDTVYALFDGGRFNAVVGAGKSAALYVNKGSADTTFKGGEILDITLKGTEPRFANVAGKLEFKRVEVTAAMPEACGSVTGARVFKSDKSIVFSDAEAHFDVNVKGPDAEIFSAADRITVDAGVFELVASDDCFSATTNITVNGGLVYAVSTANDVFDSNGDMELNGGTILAYTTADGHEAFDVDPELTGDNDLRHQLRVNGGTIFATGGKNSAWPSDLVTPEGFVLYSAADLATSDVSGKYASLKSTIDMITTAKLPVFTDKKCALMMTCPNMTGAPTFSASAPSSGSQDFHDLYIEMKGETNQSALRFLEIFGSTDQGSVEAGTFGDVGEYIVLTNPTEKVIQLAGVTVSIAKNDVKKGKIDDPKCLITLGVGTLPAYGSIRLDQADYSGAGWSKITNGNIFLKITDAVGNVVQSGYASFDNAKYTDVDGKGASLIAIYFGTSLEDTDACWISSAPPREHNWSTPTYVWSSDNTTCTASCVCTDQDCDATETETVKATYQEVSAATTTKEGKGRWTATFSSPFSTQTKDVTIAKLPHTHTWGAPTYSWSADYKSCTASASCTVSGCTEKKTESAKVNYVVNQEATTESTGSATSTATFTDSLFTTQTKNVTIPKKPKGVEADYYVSTTGSDSNDGLSRDSAFATIAKAVSVAADGKKICVLKGLYEVSAAISVSKGVTIIGDTGDPADVIVRNTKAGPTKTSTGNTFGANRVFELNNAGAVVAGIAVEGGQIGGASDSKGGNILIDSNGGTVTNCIIRNAIMCAIGPGNYPKTGAGGAAIACQSGNGLITHCVITNNFATRGGTTIKFGQWGGSVVHVQNGGVLRESLVARNSVANDNVASVVFLGSANTLMENCTIAENSVEGTEGDLYPIMMLPANTGAAQNPLIRNTLIYGNTDATGSKKLFTSAWESNYSSYLANAYVRFVNCATDATLPSGLTMINSGISLTSDFRPVEGSSVVDAGATMISSVSLDLAGNPRVQGNAVDIGCYEYGAAEPPTETVDWDHPEVTIAADTTASVAWPTLKNSALAAADAAKLQSWAKNVGKVAFESAGDIKPEAFLLNCANTDAAIATAKGEFKFTSFDPEKLPTASDFADKGYNGVVTIEGRAALDSGDWATAKTGDKFFRAVLSL